MTKLNMALAHTNITAIIMRKLLNGLNYRPSKGMPMLNCNWDLCMVTQMGMSKKIIKNQNTGLRNQQRKEMQMQITFSACCI